MYLNIRYSIYISLVRLFVWYFLSDCFPSLSRLFDNMFCLIFDANEWVAGTSQTADQYSNDQNCKYLFLITLLVVDFIECLIIFYKPPVYIILFINLLLSFCYWIQFTLTFLLFASWIRYLLSVSRNSIFCLDPSPFLFKKRLPQPIKFKFKFKIQIQSFYSLNDTWIIHENMLHIKTYIHSTTYYILEQEYIFLWHCLGKCHPVYIWFSLWFK